MGRDTNRDNEKDNEEKKDKSINSFWSRDGNATGWGWETYSSSLFLLRSPPFLQCREKKFFRIPVSSGDWTPD